MRILLINQLFQPEPAHLKGLTFASELVRLGHDVEVLTGIPNYPQGRFYPGYRLRVRTREVMDGVRVTRVPLYPSHDGSGVRRAACYASLAAATAIQAALYRRRPDVVHVYQGPATLALPAWVLGMRGVPYVLDVQDLWPDFVLESGMLRGRASARLLERWCDRAHARAARVVVLSEAYRDALVARGVSAAKIDVVYNWCDEAHLTDAAPDPAVAAEYGLTAACNFVYAGTMGPFQGLDTVVDAVEQVPADGPDLRVVLVGDGVSAEALRRRAAERRLTRVAFVPRQPPDVAARIQASADVLLIHLKDGPVARLTVPQKTQAYLASGRPVLYAGRGAGPQIVERAAAGVVCPPGDPRALADAMVRMASLSPAERERMGANGCAFYREHMSFAQGVPRMVGVFEQAAGRAGRPMAETAP